MGSSTAGKAGLLTRLARDRAGNTLAITAAAIVPLIALIGGGVDISRIYLAKTRLQQACDAGALAGRKSMTGITWTTQNLGTANNFFHTNFPDGKFGAGNPTVTYSASNTGAVTGVANIVMPMTLMGVFNAGDKALTANCTADLQLPNTDVMFVLDTTLSMNDINPGDSVSRIVALRSSVQDFYTQLQQVKPAGAHIRYGFVPYSSTVNVGMLLKRDWIQDNPEYDSRVPNGEPVSKDNGQEAENISGTDTVTTSGRSYTGTKYQGSSEKCTAPANTLTDTYTAWSAWSPSNTAVPRERSRTRTRNGTTYSAGLSNGVCWITPTIYDNLVQNITDWVRPNPNAGKDKADSYIYNWFYQRVVYPVADLKGTGDGGATVSGGNLTVPRITNNFGTKIFPWNQTNACIEERRTRRTDEGSNIPRYDMDVDLVPNRADPDTQWKPYIPGIVYARAPSGPTATSGWSFTDDAPTATTSNYYTPSADTNQWGACPTYSRKMAEINDPTVINNYLGLLKPAGYTYHDIGMLWGLRLISPQGLFASEHQAAEVNGKIARHLIFMTDGDTDTRTGVYDAWGLSALARRRTPKGSIPTNAQQNTITEQRLGELCTVAKNDKNITVWVIAFGTSLTTMLSNCASPNRAYEAKNAAELTATFSQIASQIAQLRITR